ncbi:MAG: glycosyltransferase [Candidatus Saccharibacteria bacterium]
MSNPIVSLIVPTKNSSNTLGRCLQSIKDQTYKNIEIILVDNFSNDETLKIAQKYTKKTYSKGPERSAQVNYGVSKATGKYVYKIDSDFILDKKVVEECVKLCESGCDAAVVHNSPDESISWVARIRRFEVDMYKYNLDHSSARFVRKDIYKKIGGFNASVTAGEDYDFQNKLNRIKAKIGFADAEALHLGEPRSFWKHLMKYYSYGKDFTNYGSVASSEEKSTQLGFFRSVYIKNWKKFIKHPIKGISFIFYHTLKYIFGGAGYIVAKIKKT